MTAPTVSSDTMEPKIFIFNTVEELAHQLAGEMLTSLGKLADSQKIVSLAISGGNTPTLLFREISELSAMDRYRIDWSTIHFFWVDERCVPPDHPESNFGMANKYLLQSIVIPAENIHRILGESKPEAEAERYTAEIRKYVPLQKGFPRFDRILLGMGEDGHTASVFPGQMELLGSDKICETAIHPASLLKRITLTGKVLTNAQHITFMVTGKSKRIRVKEILEDAPVAKTYPAYFIRPVNGRSDWYLDRQAAELLKDNPVS